MVHPENGILFSAENNELSGHGKTWTKLNCVLPSERRQYGKSTYCMVLTMWNPGKRQNYTYTKKISGKPGVIEGKMWTTEDFYGIENTLHDNDDNMSLYTWPIP